MAITNIAIQKTPGRPVQLSFAANGGLPTANQQLVLLGHSASGATGINTVVVINNAGDPIAGPAEAATKFGAGSELAKMVTAAINANALAGNSNFPPISCIPLLSSDTGFGSGAALAALNKIEAEFIVSPYDGSSDAVNTPAIIAQALLMSSAQRVQNSQFGTVAVYANQAQTNPSLLPKYDSQYGCGYWFRNSAPTMTVGELAAGYAALIAGNAVPFNPLDNNVIGGQVAPAAISDFISIGASLESEICLGQGWGCAKILPNLQVAVVKTVTSRITVGDGVTSVNSYQDVQDFQVLYFFRKAVFTRFNQPDFSNIKASQQAAQAVLSEVIRLATDFQTQNMFQAVSQLAKQFIVQRNISDRSRFDVFVPVNVVPGLHVIATNIQAGTQFDSFTI